MTIQQLRYFIAVAQYLHFGEAAKSCFVSQPSLSRSILDLETELGIKLVNRNNKTVELTASGEAFYADAKELIKHIDHAVMHAKRADSGFSGSIRIGILSALVFGDFPSGIMRFRNKYPDIDVILSQDHMKTLHIGLLTGALDIALMRDTEIISYSDILRWAVFAPNRYCIVMRNDHPLAINSRLPLTALADEQFIMIEKDAIPNVFKDTLRLCISRGLVPNITLSAERMDLVCTMIRSGMGISILPDSATVYGVNDLKFIPIDGDDAVTNAVLAWRINNDNSVIPLFLAEFGIKMSDASV